MQKMKKIVYKLAMCTVLFIAILGGFSGKESESVLVHADEVIPGTTIHYDFDKKTNTLQIYSTNETAMPDYAYEALPPWTAIRNGVKKVVIKSSITHIGKWAFAEFDNLEEVVIDDPSLTSIGEYAFYRCGKLKSIKLPTQIKEICNDTFEYCIRLESVNLQDTNVEKIGEYAFNHTNLKEIVMPQTLHTIEEGAFRNCLSLKYVSLPNALTKIEEVAFEYCPNMEELQCSSTIEAKEQLMWHENAFDVCRIEQIYLFKNKAVHNWFLERGYSDEKIKELCIMSDNNTNYNVQMNKIYSYTGKEICPELEIVYTATGQKLVNTQDYILLYSNNTDVGTATVKIIGKGAFSGSISKEYTISTCNLEEKGQIADIPKQIYTGAAIKPQINVICNGKSLELNKDYTVSYSNNISVGNQALVKVTGTGNYSGTIEKTFSIDTVNTNGTNAAVTIQGTNQHTEQAPAKVTIKPPKAKVKQKGNKVVVKNYCKGTSVIVQISHNGKKTTNTLAAGAYKTKKGYSLRTIKKSYKGQKIKLRVRMVSEEQLAGKWSKWIKIK